MRQAISPESGPKPAGPYSPAIACQGKLVFVSGQGPVNPATGEMPSDFRAATIQTLENVKTLVEAAGASMADVVKVHAYLRNMDDFEVFNEVYKDFFSAPYPARTTVQSGMRIAVEIDAIAVLPD